MEAILKPLGTRIRELRSKKGLSQEAFADQCGINRSHMGQVERGEINMTIATLHFIAEKLGTNISSLLHGIG
jgi:transcriptional regulator with XRE-family HTH domain